MAEQKKTATHPLSNEDRARMARLFEEITSRYEEMALITARTLGIGGPKALSEVKLSSPKPPTHAKGVRSQAAPVITCFAYSDGTCGCYNYRDQVCEPC